MKVDVFLIRHGETDWNREFRFQGQTDTPLNPEGEKQARELAAVMRRLAPEIFLSSDLQRAIRTAELANEHLMMPIERNRNLREINLGGMEGRLRDDVIASIGLENWERWGNPQDLDFGLPGGETKRDVLNRALECLREFLGSRPHLKKVAIVTHGGVVKRLVYNSSNAPQSNVSLQNCVVHHLTYTRDLDQWGYVAEIARS